MGPPAPARAPSAAWSPQRLGWHYLDSGALYRAVGVAAGWADLDLADAGGAGALHRSIPRSASATTPTASRGCSSTASDATDELRTETAGAAASAIAAIPEVRAALMDRQRAFRQPPGLVADGRDMGTVIFPDAGAQGVPDRQRRGTGRKAL